MSPAVVVVVDSLSASGGIEVRCRNLLLMITLSKGRVKYA
jgi:hypothetical protein